MERVQHAVQEMQQHDGQGQGVQVLREALVEAWGQQLVLCGSLDAG